MKTWLAAICLIIAAAGQETTGDAEELCLLKSEKTQTHLAMGTYKTIDNFNFATTPSNMKDMVVSIVKGVNFAYDLVNNPLTVKIPVASTPPSITAPTVLAHVSLNIPGATEPDLDISFTFDGNDKITVDKTETCGPIINKDESLPNPLDIQEINTWEWTFNFVDGEILSLHFKLGVSGADPLFEIVVALPDECRTTLKSTDHLLVTLDLSSADNMEIKLGSEEADPKLDGFIRAGIAAPYAISPIVDYTYLKKVLAFIASDETLKTGLVDSYVYVSSDECADITNYEDSSWTDGNTGSKDCPDFTQDRKAYCQTPVGRVADTECSVDTDYCQTCNSECVATRFKMCTVAQHVANAKKGEIVAKVGETTVGDTYNYLYLGETIEFSCPDQNQMIQYNSQLGKLADFANVHVTCLINGDGKVSDIDDITIKCASKCTTFTHIESVTMDIDLDDNYPEGYPITFTCADGYADSEGGTVGGTSECTQGGTYDDEKCFRCTLPVLSGEISYDSVSAPGTSPTHLKTLETVYIKCSTGYSLRKKGENNIESGRTQKELTCEYKKTAGKADMDEDAAEYECIEDCRIETDASTPPTTLIYEYWGEIQTIASVPQGATYTLSCQDKDLALPYGQDKEILCTKDAADVETVKECQKTCDSSTIITPTRSIFTKDDKDEYEEEIESGPISYGTPLSIFCAPDHYVIYEASDDMSKFSCGTEVYNFEASGDSAIGFIPTKVNGCFEECRLTDNKDEYEDNPTEVVNGPDNYLTTSLSSLRMKPGTAIKIQCKDEDETIKDLGVRETTIECKPDGTTDIALNQCVESCPLADVVLPNSNTQLVHSNDPKGVKVEYFDRPTIKCESDQYLIADNLAAENDEELRCGAEGKFEERVGDTGIYQAFADTQTLKEKFACVPVPQFPADQKTATAPMTMTLTVTLDASRDVEKMTIGQIELKGFEPPPAPVAKSLCTIPTPATDVHEFSCPYVETNANMLNKGITDIKATVTFTLPSVIGEKTFETTLAKAYAGPPLVTNDMLPMISAVGTKSLTLAWDTTPLGTAFGSLSNADYVVKFTLSVLNKEDTPQEVVAGTSYDYAAIGVLSEYDLSSGSLSASTAYTLQVMTHLEGYTVGGKFNKDFSTGRAPPTVTSEATSETAVTITVAAADATLAGDITLKYTVTEGDNTIKSETKAHTFADGKTTIDISSLTALTKYTFAVTIYQSDETSPPSEEVPHVFITGPAQPQFDGGMPSVKTDVSMTVSWTPINEYKYYVKLYLNPKTDGSTPVDSKEHTATSSDAVTHEFAELEPGKEYTVTLVAETTVDGTTVQSVPPTEMTTTLYRCNLAEKTTHGDKLKTDSGTEVTDAYFNANDAVIFTVECRDDYRFPPSGPNTVTTKCIATGWTEHTPCELKTCSGYDPSWENLEGRTWPVDIHTKITVSCIANYRNEGGSEFTCLEDTSFTATTIAPDCQPECTGLDTSLTDEKVVENIGDSGKSVFPILKGETVDVECVAGFRNTGDEKITCDAPPITKFSYTNIPTCVEECPGYPDSYENVAKNAKFPVLKGEEVEIECNPGFINSGGSTVTCIEQKDFSGTAPNCEKSECTGLPDTWTFMSTTAEFPVNGNDLIEVACDQHYENLGDSKVRCNKGTTYTYATEPQCQQELCPTVVVPTSGKKTSGELTNNAFGAIVIFECDEGFVMQGSAKLKCLAGKLWSGDVPTCMAVNAACDGFTVENGILDNLAPYSNSDEASVTCKAGYVVGGDNPRTCATSGWLADAPTCSEIEAGQCGPLTKPEGGVVAYTDQDDDGNNVLGTTAVASCTGTNIPLKDAIYNAECKDDDGTLKWDLQSSLNPNAVFPPCIAVEQPKTKTLSTKVILKAPYCRTTAEEQSVAAALETYLIDSDFSPTNPITCISDLNCKVENVVCALATAATTSLSFDLVQLNQLDQDYLGSAESAIKAKVEGGSFSLSISDNARRRKRATTTLAADENSLESTTTVACAPGSAASDDNKCLVCPPGYTAGVGKCVACPVGSYSTTIKSVTCSECDGGKTTYGEGTTSAAQCFDLCTIPKITKGSLNQDVGFRVELTYKLKLTCESGYDASVKTEFACSSLEADTTHKCTKIEVPDSDGGLSAGAIVGIVIAVIVILLIVIILVVFCRKRKSKEGGSSKKYSPKDAEKQNDDDVAANGENVSMASQEKKIDMGDDEEAPEVVIENKAATTDEKV